MGYLTPVILYNDSLHEINNDPFFTENLRQAILEAGSRGPQDVPLRFYRPKSFFAKILKKLGLWKPTRPKDQSGASSFAQVLRPQHADTFRLITVWGNTWTDICDDINALGSKYQKQPNLEYLEKSIERADRELKFLKKKLEEYKEVISLQKRIEDLIQKVVSDRDFRNNQTTRAAVVVAIEKVLKEYRNVERGTELFSPELGTWVRLQIKCDEENNPPDVVESRNLCVQILPPEILKQELRSK